jgi:hypothetical protein
MLSLVVAFVSGLSLGAAAEPVSKEITIAVSEVFIPETVDRNSDVKIVVSGMFPNSCYRWARTDIVSVSQTFHTLQAKAMVTLNTMCLMVLVPYSKEVNMGRLLPGEHTLRFVSHDETYFERKLVVQ